MTHLAATATTITATLIATTSADTTLPGWTVLAALPLALPLAYAIVCAAAPFGRCRRCKGVGKTLKPNGRLNRWCRRCDSTGLRLRAGRRLYNYLRRLSRDISR
ncbi:hypothetical protein AB0M50_09495 [Nonomuraea fuscirosea]|uniref:hypothetical protein n=1 Tax=Nonomuraea fuscirosea TaxID=1291556 RepID=UPI00342CA987